ncbi:hypothetical protein PIB30_066469 [Stylosanthes scabra]|uniref:Uncharacterized protein n=1 Tax=Stylosanthes scabra TaxID=79078 RepID=A0ABU6VP40_9FABA|nr:hypothetical protein [Stylosanthes scabra]
MARDGGRGRGSGRGRGRPRKNTGIPLDLRTTPPTPTTTATTSSPSLSASQGPPIHMIPTPGMRVQSTEPGGTSSQMPPPPSQPPRTPSGPYVGPTDTDGDGDDEDEEASVAGDTPLLLRWDGNDWYLFVISKGTEQITTVFKSCYKCYVQHFHLAPEEAINTWWDEWKKTFRFRKGESEKMRDAWLARAAKRLRELFHGIREKGYLSDWIPYDIFKQLKEYWASDEYLALKRTNKANRASSAGGSLHTGGSITYPAIAEKMQLKEYWASDEYMALKRTNKANRASSAGGSLHTGGSITYPATAKKMLEELGRTPTQSEVFTRTHTKKKDRGQWVDRRAEEANQQYEEELKRLEEERAALIAAGCPEPSR